MTTLATRSARAISIATLAKTSHSGIDKAAFLVDSSNSVDCPGLGEMSGTRKVFALRVRLPGSRLLQEKSEWSQSAPSGFQAGVGAREVLPLFLMVSDIVQYPVQAIYDGGGTLLADASGSSGARGLYGQGQTLNELQQVPTNHEGHEAY